MIFEFAKLLVLYDDKTISSVRADFLSIFPHFFFIFCLILVLQVGSLPIQEGPAYTSASSKENGLTYERPLIAYWDIQMAKISFIVEMFFYIFLCKWTIRYSKN